MTRAQGTIEIAAPPRRVWAWIVEPEKYLAWNTDFTQYSIVDDGQGRVGTTYYMVGEKAGSPLRLDCVITAWVENERFSFRGESREGTRAEGTFTIEPTAQGCQVTFVEDLRLPGAKGKIIEALFLKKAKTRNIEESLTRLKAAAEGAV